MIISLPLPEHDPALEISLRNTSLEVEPSADGGATARFIAAGEETPRDTGERFAVRTRESDDGGSPIVSVEEQQLDDAAKGRLLVQVPAATRLRLRSRNGGIEVRGLAGELHVRTRNGSISARDSRGPLSASAANGAVRLAAITGPNVEVSAANGSVNLEDVETPRLRVSTSNGRVRVAGARVGGGDGCCHLFHAAPEARSQGPEVGLDRGRREAAHLRREPHLLHVQFVEELRVDQRQARLLPLAVQIDHQFGERLAYAQVGARPCGAAEA